MKLPTRESFEALYRRNVLLQASADGYLCLLSEIQDIVDSDRKASLADLPKLVARLRDDSRRNMWVDDRREWDSSLDDADDGETA